MDSGLKIRALTLPDTFQLHDTPAKQYEQAHLTARHIAQALSALGQNEAAEIVARA